MSRTDSDQIKWGISSRSEASMFGIVNYPKGGRYGPVKQWTHQIVGILSGHMNVIADGRNFRVDAHHCCLLFPGQQIFLQFAEETSTQHNYVCMEEQYIPLELLNDFSADNAVAPLSLHTNTLIELAVEHSPSSYPHKEQQLNNIALAAFYDYHRALTQPTGSTGHEAIERALTFIHTNYHRAIDADSIAKASGLSRQHLTKVLREETGKTISEHLWQYRMEKARDLLIGTGFQVGEVADQTGFQTPYHMSRKLKQVYGKSPREIRASAWQS